MLILSIPKHNELLNSREHTELPLQPPIKVGTLCSRQSGAA